MNEDQLLWKSFIQACSLRWRCMINFYLLKNMLKDITINSCPKPLGALAHLVPEALQMKSTLQNQGVPPHLPWVLYFLTQCIVILVTTSVSTTWNFPGINAITISGSHHHRLLPDLLRSPGLDILDTISSKALLGFLYAR